VQYHFDFSDLWGYREVFFKGIWLTLMLTAVGCTLGIAVGIAGAAARQYGQAWLRFVVGTYVELIRNTPFIVQLFFIFFGLPALGVKLGELQAAILAMVINLGAYSTEIIRAGLAATPKGQIEAADSLAMSGAQIFRHVVLVPALRRIWPALSSQCVIVMLGSAVCSQISAEELTFAANFIASRNFRNFEVYVVTTVIYLVLAIGLRQVFRLIGKLALGMRAGERG
jgi:polar amino acid transport system permease protein